MSRAPVLERPAGAGSAPADRSVRTITGILLVTVGAGLGALVSLPTILVLLVGLLPALVAFVVDDRPGRHAFQAVAALNFAGAAPVVMTLWERGASLEGAFARLLDVDNLLLMYGAAALGWGLVGLGPVLTSLVLEFAARHRRARLEAEDRALLEEWDFDADARRP